MAPGRAARARANVRPVLGRTDEDDWSSSAMALVALEREFGLALSLGVAKDALPAISLQHLQG
ncbi:hypothetical protein [Streptomyces sp. RTd22]|uniref:hypothetical protein n=1 Tax=Streptomyces sp. RTd22 TaxID=1841249 RepID=UPI00131E5D23|nr:hypothetical protein [Streptomyces sp. RTd22]